MRGSSKDKIHEKDTQLHGTNSHNFSDKYLKYTKDRSFLTPKKVLHKSNSSILKKQGESLTRPDLTISKTESGVDRSEQHVKHRQVSGTGDYLKTAKININMEIKNLNIFSPSGSGSALNTGKKKLHKKTISCMGQHLRDLKLREQEKEKEVEK